ncbi:MAG: HEXXH motif-containing putative peptide modification protein [Brevundimonas sp.]|jgi:HEXXH motif-containing protein|uniref:aKG-HExxH-type peptide beta-hydroxylase n=1 Tax=Brevundimonas TaxID=41275 RepID=UPI0022AC02E6|nr:MULTISPECIES: HEXXH motif-containing putative peptide modification protein [Brevundimonas]
MPSPSISDLDLDFTRPWFPGLAEHLVGPVLAARGLTPATYRTKRWIDGEAVDAGPPSRFEDPPSSLIKPYAEMGLAFAAPPSSKAHALLGDAWGFLDRVPDAEQAISTLVCSIHVLEPPGPGYDTSHSDPDLPCSIFLSLPIGEPHAALRAAESILHEAMHLQLTLIEAQVPVVRASGATLYSPWQQCHRPVSGLVHGLYVFAAIDAYLAELLTQDGVLDETAAFARKRRREIGEEISEAREVVGHNDLTRFGLAFVDGLLAEMNARA